MTYLSYITSSKCLEDIGDLIFCFVFYDQNILTLVHSKCCRNVWKSKWFFSLGPSQILVPLRLRKAGMVWCGGTWETHLATCHHWVTPSKTKEFLKSPRFLDLTGTKLVFDWNYLNFKNLRSCRTEKTKICGSRRNSSSWAKGIGP